MKKPVIKMDKLLARFKNPGILLLKQIVKEITLLSFVDNIYYDITNKSPATFGWK